jgi:hypothetical protein
LYGLHTNLFLIKTGTNVLQKNGVSKRIGKSGGPNPGRLQPFEKYFWCLFGAVWKGALPHAQKPFVKNEGQNIQ